MSDHGFDLTIPAGLQPYTDDQILFRAILYKDWLSADKTKVKHQLFYRFTKDLSGLSVDTEAEACKANFQAPISGLVDLAAERIRGVTHQDGSRLDVVPTTATHGNIKRVPYRDDDRIEATYIARQLAQVAHVYEV